MVQTVTLWRRSWAGLAWLLIGSVALVAALALGNTVVLLAVLATAALSGWLLLRQAPALAGSQPAATDISVEPRAQCGVWLADGTPRQALVVPAAAVSGYQTVLTIDGYALVNAEGRVVYALSREGQAQADEPVVVTIFDTAESSFEEQLVVG
jgi:hypothetical protein